MTRFQKISIATSVATFALIAVGGLVRATGSGLGCPDWPRCHGRWIPPLESHALIEYSHRLLATMVVVLIVAMAISAWRSHRRAATILRPSVGAIALVLFQAALGGIVVGHELRPTLVTAHFGIAMLLIAALLYATISAFCLSRVEAGSPNAPISRPYARLATWGALAMFLLLLLGAYLRGEEAGLAFPDWPLMDGRLIPALGGRATPHFLHRLMALGVGILVFALAWRARRREARETAVLTFSGLAAGLYVAQVLAGAANVWSRLSAPAVVAHVALGSLTWGATVALAIVSRSLSKDAASRLPGRRPARRSDEPVWRRARERTGVYFQLTKPRIIVLLLVTTVPAMVIAARGVPSGWLILATLFGGTLAAGSANAINCYYDRDIDAKMARTRRRPLPSGRVEPDLALAFGVVLGVVAFTWLARTVNVLSALLALAAILFYVFVYTAGLKRSTPQNIVIGGAAGAVPVLVGWAAVTGRVEIPALALFGIVFVWTPPHFWALTMRFTRDYEAAGVPMLPVVAGKRETQRQILLYSLALFAITLLFAPVGRMGLIYLGSALVLGGLFVWRALTLWRRGDARAATGLFRFSVLYLALLFGAMALDQLARTGLAT